MSLIFGAESEFVSAGFSYYNAVSALTADKIVVAYQDVFDSNHGTARIGTISGTDIAYGTEAEFNSASSSLYVSVLALSPSSFVVAYRDTADSDHGTAKIGTVSGTTITFGSEFEFSSSNAVSLISLAAFSSSGFIVAYRDDVTTIGRTRIGTVSGTTITFGDPDAFVANLAIGCTPSVAVLSPSKIAVAYSDGDLSDYGYSVIGNVTGTDVTYSVTQYRIVKSAVYDIEIAALDSSKFLIAYQNNGGSNYGESVVASVTGVAITYGTMKEFFKANGATDVNLALLNDSDFVVAYRNNLDGGKGEAIIGTVTGTDIDYGDEVQFNSAGLTNYIDVAALGLNRFVVVYADTTDGWHGTSKVGVSLFTNSRDLFIYNKDTIQASGDLFVYSHQPIQASGDLFVQGLEALQASGNMYAEGRESFAASGDLFVEGYAEIIASGNLFIAGIDDASGVSPPSLFIDGHNETVASGDLFIYGYQPIQVSGDLFINGYESHTGSGDLHIHCHSDTVASGDLYIYGYVDVVASGDFYLEGCQIISGSCDLFVQYIIPTHQASGDLYIDGLGFLVASCNMFINGMEPKPPLVCPPLDPTAAIQIKASLIETYQDLIDDVIDQLGKNVLLEFDPIRAPCPNCEFDTIRKRSTGVYKTGGPRPFQRGRKCPYCKGRGFVETAVTMTIKCLTKWNPEDAETFGIAVSQAKDIVRLKTYLTDADDLSRARTVVVNYDIVDQMKMRVRLIQGPIPVGLREDRYCISFWELI